MDSLRHSDSIVIDRPADDLYAMIADIGRMGEWSPICIGADWDDPEAGAHVGAEFTGHNRTPERTWDVRGNVTIADPGRAFGWQIGEGWTRWTYEFRPVDGREDRTEVVESWEFTAAGHAEFARRFGDDADRQIEIRRTAAHEGIPATLAAIKETAERGAAADVP